MKNGNAQLAIRIYVRVEHGAYELELRRTVRVVTWESHLGLDETRCELLFQGVCATRTGGCAYLEVAAVEVTVRIDNDKSHSPCKERVILKLSLCKKVNYGLRHVDSFTLTSMLSHFSLPNALYSDISRALAP